jgi:hypothetical protein
MSQWQIAVLAPVERYWRVAALGFWVQCLGFRAGPLLRGSSAGGGKMMMIFIIGIVSLQSVWPLGGPGCVHVSLSSCRGVPCVSGGAVRVCVSLSACLCASLSLSLSLCLCVCVSLGRLNHHTKLTPCCVLCVCVCVCWFCVCVCERVLCVSLLRVSLLSTHSVKCVSLGRLNRRTKLNHVINVSTHFVKSVSFESRVCVSCIALRVCIKRDLVQCQKRPSTVSKET